MKPFDDRKTQVYHTPPHYPELAPPGYKEPNPGHGPLLWAPAPFALNCVVQQSLLIACPGPLLSLWPQIDVWQVKVAENDTLKSTIHNLLQGVVQEIVLSG